MEKNYQILFAIGVITIVLLSLAVLFLATENANLKFKFFSVCLINSELTNLLNQESGIIENMTGQTLPKIDLIDCENF